MKRYKIVLFLLMGLMIFTACSKEKADKITNPDIPTQKKDDIDKELIESVEGFLDALKGAQVAKMEDYIMGEDAEKMGLNKQLESGERANMKAFYQYLTYEFVSGKMDENGYTATVTYHTNGKSMPDLIEVANAISGPVDIDMIDTVEKDVTFQMYKENNKWLIQNGYEVFSAIIGNEKN